MNTICDHQAQSLSTYTLIPIWFGYPIAHLAVFLTYWYIALLMGIEAYAAYEFHLRLTASFASRYMYCLEVDEATEETILAAALFHDAIEDARLTYNDLKKLLTRLRDEHNLLLDATAAAEIVYALTNDKGRTRAERAGAAYYILFVKRFHEALDILGAGQSFAEAA